MTVSSLNPQPVKGQMALFSGRRCVHMWEFHTPTEMEHKTQPPDALVSNIFRRHEGSVIINTVASQQEAPNLRSCFWGHVSVELWGFFFCCYTFWWWWPPTCSQRLSVMSSNWSPCVSLLHAHREKAVMFMTVSNISIRNQSLWSRGERTRVLRDLFKKSITRETELYIF